MTSDSETPPDGEKGAILPEPIGEDGFVRPDGDGATTPGDLEPGDDRGRQYPKSDGNPYVTGDVRDAE